MVKGKSAYLYLRASSSKQDKSVDQQRVACRSYAKKEGITILGEFADDGVSAFKHGKEGRKGFNDLLEACQSGEAEFVLLWSIDRFSRQYKEGMVELLTLEIAGVNIIDTMEGEYNSEELGGAIKQVLGLFSAEQYSMKLSKNVARGIKDKKDAGYPHGMCPLGYMVNPTDTGKRKSWVPDPKTYPVVAQMFELYDKGLTFQGICKRMNELGFKPPRAEYFSAITIAQILRNPVYGGYQGTVDRRKRYSRDSMRKMKISTFIEPDLWERTFYSVQPKHRSNGEKRRMNPLTGKVFCPKCGEPAHVISGTNNIPMYRCRGVRGTVCDHRATVIREHLEMAIVEQIRECYMEEGVQVLAKRIVEEQLSKDKKLLKSIQPLHDRLEELDHAETVLLDAMIDGGDSKVLKGRRETIIQERVEIQGKLESFGEDVEPISFKDAHQRLVEDLLSFGSKLHSMVSHIDRIEVTEKNLATVWMFGYEIELDLSDWTDEDTIRVRTFIPAKMVGVTVDKNNAYKLPTSTE